MEIRIKTRRGVLTIWFRLPVSARRAQRKAEEERVRQAEFLRLHRLISTCQPGSPEYRELMRQWRAASARNDW